MAPLRSSEPSTSGTAIPEENPNDVLRVVPIPAEVDGDDSSSSDVYPDGTKSGDELEVMKAGPPSGASCHKLDLALIRLRRQKLTAQNRAQIQMLLPDSVNFRLQSGLHPMRHFPGMVVVHFDSLKAGLRFPLHPFFVSLLNYYNIVSAQIMPNSYRAMAGFICHCVEAKVTPSLDLFHYFFSIIPQQAQGYLVASSRSGHILFSKAPSSIKEWKDRFFFVSVPTGLIPRKWNAFPPKSPEPFISEDLSQDIIAVEAGGCFQIMPYLTPERLIKAGIGTARIPGLT
ncbi:unnamed protein product [Cuscuta epithymum]|uniref:Transposase (putative) gypsy type domain-containing protein n=1 Tax=Cuscuta epithymum TaxID=186058 RepID=A0AAV0DB26_9ASTE|nr:unnamed protein product [Cuscuta epithymum]